MISIVIPALLIAFALLACVIMSGVYGAALASTGLLSSLAFTLAIDAYGPVADNAGGIAESKLTITPNRKWLDWILK
jgi:K(+)-stimulated pyrophosphate-energized sodium pump